MSLCKCVSPARGRAAIAFLLLVPVISGFCVSEAVAQGPARVISADDNGVVFDVDASRMSLSPSAQLPGVERLVVQGFGTFSQDGQPALPARTFIVALPPGATYSLSHTVQQTRSLGIHRLEPVPFPKAVGDADFKSLGHEYRIDPLVYGSGGGVLSVRDEGVSTIRHQRVLGISVSPVTYDPASGATSIATRIRVTVRFNRGSGLDRSDAGTTRRPVQESPTWDRILSGLLVNPGPARKWRVQDVPTRAPDLRTRSALDGPHVKTRVYQTGLTRLSAADAIARGYPAGIAIADLQLFSRSYDEQTRQPVTVDVPFKVVEGGSGTAGVFDGADYIAFYARSVREDDVQADAVAKFSDYNMYWLGTNGGTVMQSKALTAAPVAPDVDTAVFPVTRHFEEDLNFKETTPEQEKDFYTWHSEGVAAFSMPFTLDAINASGSARLTARLGGGSWPRASKGIGITVLNSQGSVNLTPVTISRDAYVTYQENFGASQLIEGLNTLRLTIASPDPGRPTLDAALNWFELDYESPYRAINNTLLFNSAFRTGVAPISVKGLTTTDVVLFDVTDPAAPVECTLTPGHFSDDGSGGFILSFERNYTQRAEFLLTTLAGATVVNANDIEADVPSNIIGSAYESGVDVLVVSPAGYLAEVQRWVDYRRSQGYRVLMVDVAEVFDEFSGGLPQARAVRRFTRHFLASGNASYLVLVGDATEDARHKDPDSQPNFVPTESYTEFVGAGFDENEVVTTDKWYVIGRDYIELADAGAQVLEFVPDLIVGRFPAGTVNELRIMIDKVLTFEDPKPGDLWRRRALHVADDAWVPNTPLGPICNGGQIGFERAEEAFATISEQSLPGGFDVVRLYLSQTLTYPAPPTTCTSAFGQIQECRQNFVPKLFEEVNRGAHIVSFQAHMNREQYCHEQMILSENIGYGLDHRKFNNVGKPFLMFAFGCHSSDYAVFGERRRAPDNGDCLSELILLRDNRGAVAVYGSAGYEYLGPNEQYTNTIADNFYMKPPTQPIPGFSTTQARWVAGEVLTAAEIENLVLRGFGSRFSGDGGVGMIKRYHVLGDPLLRMDAGPPRFDVTVDGDPFESGSPLTGSGEVSIRAEISDEVAIENIGLMIEGQDATDQLTITSLDDPSLDAARRYEVTFTHEILPRTYDIILRAEQFADTSGTTLLQAGEFILKVLIEGTLTVNGRPIQDGDIVPPQGDYVIELTTPVAVSPTDLRVEIDGEVQPGVTVTQPEPTDSTMWRLSFSPNLSAGPHTIAAFVGDSGFTFDVVVAIEAGLRNVIAYPNPFETTTQIVFTNDIAISGGRIDIFTTSGRKVRELSIPSVSLGVGQNAVEWDGRDFAGDEVANGVYLFVINVNQSGQETTTRGKLAKVQ